MKSTASTAFVMLVTLMSLVFIPSFVYVALGASSTTPGFLVSVVMILGLLLVIANKVKVSYKLLIYIVGFFLIISIYMIPALDTGLGKPLASILPAIIVITTGFLLGAYIRSSNYYSILPSIKLMSFCLILLGILSIFFEFPILNYDSKPKSIFPFSEPSHYAIFSMPILMATAFLCKGKTSVTILLICFLFGIIYPSVIILVYVWLYLALVLPVHKLVLSTILVLTISVYMLSDEQASYFADRVLFSSESENLTALVYMQGWQEMVNAFVQTKGVGTGFQKNGSIEPGSISVKIYKIAGIYKNREDGGFLASKIVSEFGVLGVFFVVFYVKYFLSSFRRLKENAKKNSSDVSICKNNLFFHLMIYFIIVELFFRGIGYFSTGVFFLCVSVSYLHKIKVLRNDI